MPPTRVSLTVSGGLDVTLDDRGIQPRDRRLAGIERASGLRPGRRSWYRCRRPDNAEWICDKTIIKQRVRQVALHNPGLRIISVMRCTA